MLGEYIAIAIMLFILSITNLLCYFFYNSMIVNFATGIVCGLICGAYIFNIITKIKKK